MYIDAVSSVPVGDAVGKKREKKKRQNDLAKVNILYTLGGVGREFAGKTLVKLFCY